MIQSQVTALAPAGAPWGQAPNGPNYPYSITFADGTYGQCNFRSTQPWCKVGDNVWYDVNGEYQGTPRIKLHKNPQNQPAQGQQRNWGQQGAAPQNYSQPQQTNYQPPQQSAPASQGPAPIHGQTVGMSINNAIEVALKIGLLPHQPDFWPAVYEYSSMIIRMSRRLEKGELHQISKTQPQASPAPAPQPQQQRVVQHNFQAAPQNNRPQPGPDGQAFNPNDADQDVPF